MLGVKLNEEDCSIIPFVDSEAIGFVVDIAPSKLEVVGTDSTEDAISIKDTKLSLVPSND